MIKSKLKIAPWIAILCSSAYAEDSVANTRSAAAADDGFSVTPKIMTATGDTSEASNAVKTDQTGTTIGLEYKGQRTFSFGKVLTERLTHVHPPDPPPTTALSGMVQIQTSGKIAANRHIDVGDMLDTKASAGAQYEVGSDSHPFAGYATTQGLGSFEYGQRLSTRNYTYGLDATAHFYSTPSTPEAALWLDVFDWPGYVLRRLTMDGRADSVRAADRSWPTLALQFARVEPQKDDARKAIDPGLAAYNRLHILVSGGTQIGQLPNGRDLVVNFRYDHWREINPKPAIEAAHLARQSYRAIELVARGTGEDVDWLITYSSGAVPTDQSATKLWELGWKYSF